MNTAPENKAHEDGIKLTNPNFEGTFIQSVKMSKLRLNFLQSSKAFNATNLSDARIRCKTNSFFCSFYYFLLVSFEGCQWKSFARHIHSHVGKPQLIRRPTWPFIHYAITAGKYSDPKQFHLNHELLQRRFQGFCRTFWKQ